MQVATIDCALAATDHAMATSDWAIGQNRLSKDHVNGPSRTQWTKFRFFFSIFLPRHRTREWKEGGSTPLPPPSKKKRFPEGVNIFVFTDQNAPNKAQQQVVPSANIA
jgi:hypothetical protein